MADLSDTVAIVTGASSGIGEAIAIKLAAKGAKVTLCGRDKERLKASMEKCVKASGGCKRDRFITVSGDVTSPETRKQIVQDTISKFGKLDTLVANAGVSLPGGTIKEATEDVFDKIINTNLKATFFLIQTAVPELEKSKGSVINISSCLGLSPNASQTIYCMTKAALDHMTRCVALDLGPKGVRINSVQPAFIPTKLIRSFAGEAKTDEIGKGLAQMEDAKHPLYGRCGTAEEVADAVSFLASKEAGFITGQSLAVDGGRHYLGMM